MTDSIRSLVNLHAYCYFLFDVRVLITVFVFVLAVNRNIKVLGKLLHFITTERSFKMSLFILFLLKIY